MLLPFNPALAPKPSMDDHRPHIRSLRNQAVQTGFKLGVKPIRVGRVTARLRAAMNLPPIQPNLQCSTAGSTECQSRTFADHKVSYADSDRLAFHRAELCARIASHAHHSAPVPGNARASRDDRVHDSSRVFLG